MGKILVFVVTMPLLCLMIYYSVFFFEYDTRQRYLKDLLDNAAYKVKITGVLTEEDRNELLLKLGKLGISNGKGEGIILKKGTFAGGELSGLCEYTPGEFLQKGDAFMVQVISEKPARLTALSGGAGGEEVEDGLFYTARALCRVELR